MSADLPPKQLTMVISANPADRMPEPVLPPGYEVRGYLPGDEDRWVDLINTGEFGSDWDRARLDEFIRGPERAHGSRLVVSGDRIVAATFASAEPGPCDLGRVDFVVSDPEVRGLGLGRVVCTEVVRYVVDQGYPHVVLYTDDWRLPATGLYLSMGFEPQMTRSDMTGRWRRVLDQLEVPR